MRCTTFWIFLACFGARESNGVSDNILRVQTFHNGFMENDVQTQQKGQHHDLAKVWAIPVDVPALRPNPAIVVKLVTNDGLRFFDLIELSDGEENNTVVGTIYNVTDITKDEAITSDLKKLKTLKRKDLQTTGDCTIVYDVVKENVVVASHPYCKISVNGKHPRFGVTLTCDTIIVTTPSNSDYNTPEAPYVFRRIGPRYPLINAPKDFVSPCPN